MQKSRIYSEFEQNKMSIRKLPSNLLDQPAASHISDGSRCATSITSMTKALEIIVDDGTSPV